MIDLIILDLYGTIWGSRKPPRNGFYDFFDRYDDKKIVLATDDPNIKVVTELLTGLEIFDRLDQIYTGRDMKAFEAINGKRKDLRRICNEFEISLERTVFISDGDKDKEIAQRDGIPFIHVPYYEKSDENFSFATIDLSKKLPKYLDLRDVNL